MYKIDNISNTSGKSKLVINFLLLTIIFSILFGCGFSLRGTQKEALPAMFKLAYLNLDGTNQQYLNAQLRRLILSNGGVLVDKTKAKTSINVSTIRKSSRQIAISGDHSLKEYENTYAITVSVYNLENNILLGTREIKTLRYIQLNDREVLATEEQEEITVNAAIGDLSKSVLRYLNTFN